MDNKTYYTIQNPFRDLNLSPEQKKKLRTAGIVLLVILIAVILFSSCWFTVEEKQSAVVTTFGKVTDIVEEAGMHFKAPFGIQKVRKVNVNEIQKIEIGFTSEDNTTVSEESKMITGDFNIVNVDFFVEYRIANPEKYLYASTNPEGILKNLVQSQIRTIVGSYMVDDVLTTKKSQIQSEIKETIVSELASYDVGIVIESIKIQDAEAPTDKVAQAFKAVETAKQGKETAINEAEAYQNAEIPKAEAEADKLLQNAQFLKQSRINEAREEVAMFEAVYSEYQLKPEITRKRMYYEMIEETLPGVRLYVMNENGTQTLLPLDQIR